MGETCEVRLLSALADDETGWRDLPLPDSAPPARLLRLHLDRASSATVSLVRFQRGWARPGVGHYTAGEEFVVLAGELQVSGARHRAGDVVYLPPRVPRWDSAAPEGALALAWFSGVPDWHSGASGDGCVPAPGGYTGPPVVGPLRAELDGVPGSSDFVASLAAESAGVDRDVLWLNDAAWAWVPAGTPAPTRQGPAFVRAWQ